MVNFPTGKPHVSYSEVRCWKECSFRHKLLHIDKIDVFKPSPYLDFGTQVHEGCESYLNTKTVPKERLLENNLSKQSYSLNPLIETKIVLKKYSY